MRIDVWEIGGDFNYLKQFGLSMCAARIEIIENGKAIIFKSIHVVENGNEDYGKIMACSKAVTKMIDKYKYSLTYPLN